MSKFRKIRSIVEELEAQPERGNSILLIKANIVEETKLNMHKDKML